MNRKLGRIVRFALIAWCATAQVTTPTVVGVSNAARTSKFGGCRFLGKLQSEHGYERRRDSQASPFALI